MSPILSHALLVSLYFLAVVADDCLSSNTKPRPNPGITQARMVAPAPVAPPTECPADDWVIAAIPQGQKDTFRCPGGGTFTSVDFAGWGSYRLTSNGQFVADSNCQKDVKNIVSNACIGQQQCSFAPDASRFGKRCPGLTSLAVRMQCSSSLTPKNIIKTTIQENQKGTLSCKAGEVIVGIDFASYGRQLITASGFQLDPRFNCNSAKSMGNVQQQCLGRNSCTLLAANKFFDDPCENVGKSLAVQARCASAASFPKKNLVFVVNEHSKQTLKCPNGRFGNVIWAGYGKQFRDANGFKIDPKYKCNSDKPHKILQKRCQGKSECEVEASNKHFGDPCKKVLKSLGIEIECISY